MVYYVQVQLQWCTGGKREGAVPVLSCSEAAQWRGPWTGKWRKQVLPNRKSSTALGTDHARMNSHPTSADLTIEFSRQFENALKVWLGHSFPPCTLLSISASLKLQF